MGPLTCSCFLLLLLGRLFLLALLFLHGICLHCGMHRFLSMLSLTLTLSPLMIWCFGLMVLFFLLLAKAALAYLATDLSEALRPLFPFSAGPVCSSYSAEACAILHALSWSCSTNKPATSLLLLSDFRSVFRVFFSQKLCGRSGSNCLFSLVLSGYNRSSDTRFSQGTTRLMSWPDGERFLCPL